MVLQISWQLTSEEEAEVQHTNSSVISTKDDFARQLNCLFMQKIQIYL